MPLPLSFRLSRVCLQNRLTADLELLRLSMYVMTIARRGLKVKFSIMVPPDVVFLVDDVASHKPVNTVPLTVVFLHLLCAGIIALQCLLQSADCCDRVCLLSVPSSCNVNAVMQLIRHILPSD